jgi:dihydrolipoamide dehydrogenase
MIGWGRFTGTHGIAVDMKVGGTEEIKAKNIIIATGSEPNELKDLPFDEKYLCSS